MTKDPMDFQIDLIIQSLRQSQLVKDARDLALTDKEYSEQLRNAIRSGLMRFRSLYRRGPIRIRY